MESTPKLRKEARLTKTRHGFCFLSPSLEFWIAVETKTPPAVSASDNPVIVQMFPEPDSELVENQDIEDRVAKLQQVKDDISALTDEKEMLEAEIKSAIGEHLGVLTEKFKVTWPKYQQTKVNTERLKADGLYEKYADKSSYRRLNISEKKAA